MQKERTRFRRILPGIGQSNRPSSALFFISAIAALWLASIVLGTVHGSGGSPAHNASPSARVLSGPPQKSAITTPVWQDISPSTLRNRIAEGVPANARTLALNADALAEVFKAAPMEFTVGAAASQAVLALPMPDGKFEQFRLVESPIMEPDLLKKFPEIKSYSGQGVDNPRMTMRCDYSPRGFNTLVLSDGKAVSIHPARWDDTTTYVSYYGQEFQVDNSKPLCGVDATEESKAEKWNKPSQPLPLATGSTLRQYRLAIAVTQEYYNQPSLGGGTLANAVASLNTWLNAVDAVYEREFAERMILVNNTSIIFTAEPDGLTNGDKNTEIDQVKVILQNQVGLANYDVGHLLSYVPGGGGLAGVGVVCSSDNNKGRGVSEVGPPNANYDGVHVFSHELGHQHGATHSWNGCLGSETSRTPSTAWEVGSGFTIMSYGGVCTTDNIVPFRSTTELRFHVGSYEQANNYISTTTCATNTSTGNHPPTVDAGTNYTIPKLTPFMLTASASDPDPGDISNLTYCWEELDAGGANYGNPPYDDSGDPSTTTRPIFRAYSPTTSPSRMFPALTYILNYANDPPDMIGSPAVRPGEELPRIGRTLNFRVTARDNRSSGGGVSNDAIVLTVDGSSGPFLVTAPNTAVTWAGGSSQTVTWSVNNTNAAPINCANVKITLSTDGGNTFPIVLAASTANDGSESVSVPNGIQTPNARVKVQSIGNVFFDISDVSFTITAGATCPAVTSISPQAANIGATVTITGVNFTGVSAVKFSSNVSATFTVNSDTQITATVPSGAVGGPIALSKSGCADAQTANFAVCTGSSTTMVVDDGSINFVNAGTYSVNRLTPSSYPATLTHVQVYNYGNDPDGPPLGTPLTILAGANQDGDATINGAITQQVSATVQTRWAYNIYAIAPITITSGDFVVGFYMAPPVGYTYNLSMDGTAPFAGRSYYSSDGTNFSLDSGSVNYMIRGQYLTGCTVVNTISPTSQDFLASGGSGSVTVSAVGAWTAVSNDAWITVTSGASGSNGGTVNYSVAVNNGASARSGTITIAGQTFTVAQSACAFSISPTSQSFSGSGTGSVSILTPTGCAWTATSNDSWIAITSGASGTGDGTVNYSIAANNTGAQRTGTLTVAGLTFTVTEAACSFSISPTSRNHAAAAGGGSVDVTTGGGCNWTATSNDSWITVASTCSGTAGTLSVDDGGLNNAGSGTTFVNRLTPTSYPATLTKVSIYFHNLVGTSGGLPYALPAGTPVNILVGTNTDGDSTINNSIVQTTAGTVQSTGAFNTYDIAPVTISSGDFVIGFSVASGIAAFPCPRDLDSPQSRSYSSGDAVNFSNDTSANYMLRGSYYSGCPSTGGSGSGAAIYSITTNNTGASRSGTMTIAGQTFTVTQAACAGAISPSSRTHTASAAAGTIGVTASSCTWAASSNASWLSITSACSGSPSTLSFDSGSITNTRGSGSYYVNRLTPASYPATLSQVSIYWYGADGNPPTGTPLTIVVGNNADGDTDVDNTSFQSTSVTVGGLFQFNTYDITPVTINSGDFVVGFFMASNASITRALAMEGTAPLNSRSYQSVNGATFSLDSSFDYMIRGTCFAGCSSSTATGNGTVIYAVAGNNSGAQRTGTLTVAGQTFTVTQNTCASTTTFYADADGDGFGNPNVSITGCAQPPGYVSNNLDCNDSSAAVNPGAAEVCGNGIDDNCDGIVDGFNNNALNFDGVNDFVRVPHFNRPATMTIETWVKAAANTGEGQRTILSWVGVSPNTQTVEFRLVDGNVSYLEFVNGTSNGTGGWFVGDDNWHHVALVRNGNGANNVSIYVDGVLKQISTVSLDTTTSKLRIGGMDFSNGTQERFFKGSLDELRIWSTARTAAQIQANMLTALSGSESGLLRLYNFNRGTAGANNAPFTSLPESSSNAATGTLNSFTLSGSTSNYVAGAPITDPRFSLYYADSDGDGYGNPSSSVQACSQPAGYVSNNLDCDDTKASVNITKPEICGNGIDDNCDGAVDSSLNNALNFDGSNDFVVVPHVDRPSTMTIEAWVKTNSTSGLNNIVTWTGYSPNLHTAEFRVENGNITYAEYTSSASLGSGAWSVSDNNWHHVALVRNGNGTNNVTIYVDGVLRITSTVNLTTVTSALRIGCFDWNANNLYYNHDRFFVGSMDEVRIWNVARTQAQIQANMSAPLVGNESGLLRYYNFNRGTAAGTNTGVTSLYDLTSNMANGTLGNFALSGSTSNWVAGAPMAVDNSCSPPGSLQYAGAPYTDNETNSDHTFTVNVSRTGGSNGVVSVNYAVTDGTATAGSDYTVSPASGTLTWAHGDTANKSFTITIKGDTTAEASETINLALSAAAGGATLGSPNPTTLTITDDDSRDLGVTAVTVSQLASPYSATTPVIGESVWVKVDYQTNNLPAGSSYRIQATMDGVPISLSNLTSGAGAAGAGGWSWILGGWYATTGSHTINVSLDADNTVAETNETNNTGSASFTTASPTSLPNKFVTAIGGVPFGDWQIQNYVDVDTVPVTWADFNGGTFAYDAHNGHDIVLPNFARMDSGIPVYAAADGTVTEAVDGNSDRNISALGQPANYVYVSHGNGWETQYYHLLRRSIAVKVGQTVTAGQLIGLVGSSGNSTDAHLHIGVYRNGALVEPMYSPTAYYVSPFGYQGTRPSTITDMGVINYSPSTYQERPAATLTYSTLTPQNPTVWFRWSHLAPGTSYQVKWYRPNGSLAATFNNTPPSSMERAGVHAWAIGSGNLPGNLGIWRVAVEIGGTELKSTTFVATGGAGDPGIILLDGSTYITNHRTTQIDFGSAAQGAAAVTKTFTVQNHGTATMNLSNLSLPAGFSLNGTFPATVAAGGSATFAVNMTTSTVGSKFGAIRFTTDDPTSTSFDFHISGTITGTANVNAPVITLSGPAMAYATACQTAVIDSLATLTDADSLNFAGGSLTVSFSTVSATADQLGIRNVGTEGAQIGTSGSNVTYGGTAIGTFAGGTSGSPLTISLNANATLAATQELIRNITFKTSDSNPATLARYVLFSLSDGSNTSNQAVGSVITDKYSIGDINVLGNGVSIADGDATPSVADFTDFGSASVSSGVVSHTFTIQNAGTAALNLTGTPKVNITGTNAADFSVTAQPSSPVAASGATTFTIQFDPSAIGVRTATVTISNDDCDEGTYDFSIQGTGTVTMYRSTGSGDWNASSSWEMSTDGSTWVAAPQTPASGNDGVTVRSPNTLTVTANVSTDHLIVQSGATLTVNNGVTLTVNDSAGVDLTVNGTAKLIGTGAIAGAGSFTLSSGATLEIGSTAGIDSGTSAGCIRVSGTRTFDSGANYVFNGSAAQVTGSGFPTIVNGLTVSNSAGVTLSADTTVNGVLALTNGDITTSSHNLIMGVGAPGSTGNGDVVGNVNRTDVGSTVRTFGNPNVQITETAGTVSSITVNLVKGLTANDFSNSVKRIYTITANNGALSTASVRLHYLNGELNSNTESSLVLWRKDSTLGWQAAVGTTTTRFDDDAPDANWVQLDGVTQFSPWTIASPTIPTDVAMMNFKATRYDKHVLLEWQTGYEVSNVGFNIYREKNGNLERVTPEPVAGSALIAGPRVELKAGLAYSWWDEEEIAECGMRNAECENRRYWIEDIDLSGRTTTHGPFGVSEAAIGDRQSGDQLPSRKQKSQLLSALGRDASLAQSAEAATIPVEPKAKVAKLTAARMSIQSGVASQTAVKLSIQREGWYRVEQADLAAAGLPSSADPMMLQLLADGREVPMLITGTTAAGGVGVGGGGGVKTTAWDGIEFYGLGIDSPSTANHVYWLVVGSQPGLRIGAADAKSGSPAPGSFSYAVERRDKTVYFPALKNGGAEKWFGPLMFNAQPVDQSVNVQHVAPSVGGLLLVSLQGFNNTAHTVRVLFNGVEVGTMHFTGLQKAAQKFVIQSSNLHEGVNQIQLIGPPGTSDLSMVEFVQLSYAHTNTADNNSLRMPATGQQQVTIDGFTGSAIRVMDVTDANSPVELQTTVNGAAASKTATSSTYSVTIVAPSSGARTLLAFASDQRKSPAAIVANQPSNYRDPGQRADYLVITRKDLIGSLDPLIQLRTSQNLLSKLIDIEDIYDEFSFGNKTPQALKDFLAYAKTSWAKTPRFVVLAGDATYDPKNYAGLGDFDLVPTRLVETAYNEAATDDWFGDVNGDGVPDMAIGRLPVRTPAEAAAMVTKLVSYDSSIPSPNVLLVVDRNSSFDFESADAQLRALIPASLTVTDIRRGQLGDADARTQLLAALNQGAKIVNYYGHGSTTVWTDAPILSASDGAGLTNSAHLSLVVSMTCLNGYFHAPNIESLGESLLKSQGGAIAVWASSGLTDAQAQTVMSRDAINRLLSGSNLTIGEVVALAKGSVTNLDVRRTWILLGDPATRLR